MTLGPAGYNLIKPLKGIIYKLAKKLLCYTYFQNIQARLMLVSVSAF